MRLTFVTEFFPPNKQQVMSGGVEARTSFIYKHLHHKHQIQVISRKSRQITAKPASIIPRLLFQIAAVREAWKKRADLIEGSNFTTYLPAYIAAKLQGVPAIAWFPDVYKGVWFQYYHPFTAVTGYFLEWISLRLPWTHIIAMSQSTRNKLVAAHVNPNKITVVYGGVDVDEISRLTVSKTTHPSICTISRLVNYKRTADVIDAVSKVRRKLPHLHLHIIGEGPERTALQDQVKRLELQATVTFHGGLPHHQAMKLLKSCHLFCLPSLVEGFGLVTVEAMAAGTPYINSDIPATREITQNGVGGLLFPSQNTGQLAQSMQRLLTDKKIYHQKQAEGKAFARQYDWKKIARQTETVYQNAVLAT